MFLADSFDSGAMSVDMVPMLIQQGFRAIAVQFDVWGLSKLIHGSLTQARAAAKQVAAEANGESNGESNEAKE
jgi:4-hydroxy-2-oxoheptanedioate aldolase